MDGSTPYLVQNRRWTVVSSDLVDLVVGHTVEYGVLRNLMVFLAEDPGRGSKVG
jgi:hypothetical protein